MDLRARLRAMIDAHGLTQTQVAERADIPAETLNRILTGATQDPGISTIARIAHGIGETVGSLLGEKGFDLDGSEQQRIREFLDWMATKVGEAQPPLLDAASRPNATELSIVSDRHRTASPNASPIPAEFRRSGASHVFRATDDSMTAAGILDGDLLFVRSVGMTRMAAGKIVVCTVRGRTYVKKLEMADRRIRLFSANDRYAPIEVKREEIEFVGIVLGRMGAPVA